MREIDTPLLIREKIDNIVDNEPVREFIYEILTIEKRRATTKWKIVDYEEALAKHVEAE